MSIEPLSQSSAADEDADAGTSTNTASNENDTRLSRRASFRLTQVTVMSQELKRYYTQKKFRIDVKEKSPTATSFKPLKKFWEAHKNELPNLYILAKNLLGAPPSSVYSERLWSEYGDIYDKKRSRILPTRGNKMLFLHHNYPLIQSEEVAKMLKEADATNQDRDRDVVVELSDDEDEE